MGRRLIIHIGAPKAGSSALQQFFALNADCMRRQGIFYPLPPNATDLSQPQSGNGFRYAKALALAPNDPATRAFFRKRLARPHPTLLLSSEFFWGLGEDGWSTIIRECRHVGCELQLLAYLRPQTDWLVSIYSQRLRRHGEHRSMRQLFLDTREDLIYQNRLVSVMRFAPMLRLYVSHGLCNDAASCLGLSGPFEEPAAVNIGVGPEEATTLRARNAAAAGVALDTDPAFMTPELHAEMADFFAPYNEEISRRMNAPLQIGAPVRLQMSA